ncbi:MAG: hypothetical protein ABIH83_00285 [Candidatus Micrarchaeota archaeon]
MKKETILIFLVIVTVIALLYFSSLFNTTSEVDAKKFFMEDLEQSYPDADVREIIYINKVGEGSDAYYLLRARVSNYLSTPCPERIEVEYQYPARNFLKTDEKVVSGCQVCIDNRPNCHISYPEEAIIASHTYEGTEAVQQFLDNYPSAIPSASLLDEYDGGKNIWKIRWTSKTTNTSMDIFISQKDNEVVDVAYGGIQ